MAVTDQLAHCTARIEVTLADGETGTGTGFFYGFAKKGEQHVPTLVTNRHVVKGAVRGVIHITSGDGKGNPIYGDHTAFAVENFEQQWTPHPEADIDLAAMPLAGIFHRLTASGKAPFLVELEESIMPSAEDMAQ